MKTKSLFLGLSLMAILGCTNEETILPQDSETLTVNETAIINDGSAMKALDRPNILADCEIYASVVTKTSFKPEAGNFDELYKNPNGFREGIPLISDSKPGDRDFNGGRWHVNTIKETVDPAKYMDACSAEDLDPNDFDSTDTYFECPVLPRKANH
jgi:hypothetical protein